MTLVLTSAFATLAILTIGLIGFYRGGEFNRRYGNLMMRLRVISQGVTLVLIMLFLMTRG
ncbi:MAG: HIG1 domain-containing protein [Geminicoccaceae bacterium]